MSLKPIKILLIEDNPGDIELVKIGLEEARMANEITVFDDGQVALDFFEQGEDLPDIILLDINLPKVDGFEILRKIRTMEASKNIPVVMLTSSEAEVDITRGYAEHVNCFVSKPVDGDKFLNVVRSLESFWLAVVKLPNP